MGVRAEASAMQVVSGGSTQSPEPGGHQEPVVFKPPGELASGTMRGWAQASFPISPRETPLVPVLHMEGLK